MYKTSPIQGNGYMTQTVHPYLLSPMGVSGGGGRQQYAQYLPLSPNMYSSMQSNTSLLHTPPSSASGYTPQHTTPYYAHTRLQPTTPHHIYAHGQYQQPIPLSHVALPAQSPLVGGQVHALQRVNSRGAGGGGKRSTSPPGAQGIGPTHLRKLFIGGLSHDTNEDLLIEYYGQHGNVIDAVIIRDPLTKVSRGFGFVTYEKAEEADAALAARPHMIHGKQVDAKKAIPREEMPGYDHEADNHSPIYIHRPCQWDAQKIYIKGLAIDRSSARDNNLLDEIRNVFAQFGSVQQVEISLNPRRLPFVVLDNPSAVDRAVAHGQLSAQTINARAVTLIRASDMPVEIERAHAERVRQRQLIHAAAQSHHGGGSAGGMSVTSAISVQVSESGGTVNSQIPSSLSPLTSAASAQ